MQSKVDGRPGIDLKESRQKEINGNGQKERNSIDMSQALMPKYADWLEWARDIGLREV